MALVVVLVILLATNNWKKRCRIFEKGWQLQGVGEVAVTEKVVTRSMEAVMKAQVRRGPLPNGKQSDAFGVRTCK